MGELNRLLRHSLAPIVTWLVANGYLPDYMQNDVTEAAVIGASIALPILISWLRDRRVRARS